MKIGILTQYYSPELGAPQRRLSGLAERLARRGHDVTVLTAMPSYPKGKVFDGYGGWHSTESLGDVDVHRVATVPAQSAAIGRRLLNYGSFVAASALAGPACFGKRLDVLLTESPPLFLGLSGYWLSRACRARWIFNVSDLWPESAVRLGVAKNSLMLRAAYALEAFCYRKAWLVTGQSETIVANIARRFPRVRTYHFSNGVDTARFRPELAVDDLRARLRNGHSCSALYAGLHGLAQGLDYVVAAAGLVEADLQVTMIGDGPLKARLVAQAAAARAPVRFEDPQPADTMPQWVAAADICLVTLGLNIPGAVPSKLYEAMGAGRAVVLMASGEAADVVKEHKCGLVVEPGDVEGLAAALRSLAGDRALRDQMGKAGRAAALANFDRDAAVAAFAELLEADESRT